MKHKIGIFGSAVGESAEIVNKAKELGAILGEMDVILISGATTGLPQTVIREAVAHGKVENWGFSAGYDEKDHAVVSPGDDASIYSKLLFVPESFPFPDVSVRRKYRNVLSTATCDAGIIVSGRWGSMNEFTNLFDMGKVIGVLTETGGIADELETLSKKVTKKSSSTVIYDSSPKELIARIAAEIEKRSST